MKYYIILLITLIVLNVQGQTQKKSQTNDININILESGNFKIDSLTLFHMPNYFGYNSRNIVVPDIGIKLNSTFRFKVSHGERFTYITLMSDKKNTKDPLIFMDYPAEPGDNISIKNENGVLSFSGKGFEKYEALYEIRHRQSEWLRFYKDSLLKFPNHIQRPEMQLDSAYYSFYPQLLKDGFEYQYSYLNFSLKLLKQYQSKIPTFIYNVIRTNLIGKAEGNLLRSFNFFSVNFGDNCSATFKLGIQDSLYEIYTKHLKYAPDNLQARRYSADYSAFIIDIAADSAQLKQKGFIYLKENYTGELRDRLIALYFGRTYHYRKNSEANVSNALTFVKSDYCRDILKSFSDLLNPGADAYKFSLLDTSGKYINLEDFKGKVVVVDFWFTGCIGCKALNPFMKTIENALKNNNSVVFISVNIDKDKAMWKGSVKTHDYTGERTTDLFTNGSGSAHPIIGHYKIMGYPTLVIIDKAGKIISTNPTRPVDSYTQKNFIALLKNYSSKM